MKERQQYMRTSAYIDVLLRNSTFFKAHAAKRFPRFDQSDLEIGRELGRGEFSLVSEITHVKPPPSMSDDAERQPHDLDGLSGLVVSFSNSNVDSKGNTNDPQENGKTASEKKGIDEDCLEEVEFMSRECLRHGISRYAIKRIKPNLSDDKKMDSMIDLALESKFLSILSHPNIIHMRGIGLLPCHSSFFIILDRLYETLSEKILSWKEIADSSSGFLAKMKKSKKNERKQLWADRILAAYDISRAIRYLHEHEIVYRDLKPENIGFDVRGDAKVFDFGLSKELHERDSTGDGLYNMSGLTGSRRYMAPEVVLCLPYNEKVDTYSFGILLWEMCALEVPFSGYDAEKHSRRVVRQHERPKIGSSWPVTIQDLIKESWSVKIDTRPSFHRICSMLGHEATQYVKDKDVLNRSSHMMDSSVSSRRESVIRSMAASNS